MRNLSILGCIFALFLGSGCQSGGSGFRNPFKGQFARTFPNSTPELQTKSKELREEDRSLLDAGDRAAETSTARTSPVSRSPGSADMQSGGPKSELVLMQEKADAEFSAGHLEQAAALYQELINLHPQDVHAHHRLAIIQDQLQAYSLAEQHYKSALAIEPENVSILNDLGYSYYLQKRYEDSKMYLEYIQQIKPDNQLAMRNLALVHAAQGDVQHSYALFQQGGLNPEESQQQIQLAIAHAGQGSATTRENSMGIASTQSEPPTDSASQIGLATVGKPGSQPASDPGQSEIRSDRGIAFQPTTNGDSAYGNNPHQVPGKFDLAAQQVNPAAYTATSETGPLREQRSVARQEHPADYRVEHVSYNTSPGQQETHVATTEDIIRTALNTGYGNLFPVISTRDFSRTQKVSATVDGLGSTDARNAYYEEFGQQPSATPHVVHANSVRSQVTGGEPPGGHVRQASFELPRESSNGSFRIQSPSYESGSRNPMMHAAPTNSFPVTQAVGHRSTSAPDYSQFPKQERPPTAVSTGTSNPPAGPGSESSGMLFVPDSAQAPATGDPDSRNICNLYIDNERSYELESDTNEYAPPAAPMSEQDRKAHELALERFRRMQQQQ